MHSIRFVVEWECDLCGAICPVTRDGRLTDLPPAGWGEVIDHSKEEVLDVCDLCLTNHASTPASQFAAEQSSPHTQKE
jgi:hypothetical protein